MENSVNDPGSPFPIRSEGQFAPTPVVTYRPDNSPFEEGVLSSVGRSSALARLANAPMQQAIKGKKPSGLTLARRQLV